MKALCSAAAAMLICAAPAFAAVQDMFFFSADLPKGWTFERAQGMDRFITIYDRTKENAINIRFEPEIGGSLADAVKEGHEAPVEVHNGVASAKHDWGTVIAAVGQDGTYLEIDVNTPLLKAAPAIIRTMKADKEHPELKPVIEKLASDEALKLLK